MIDQKLNPISNPKNDPKPDDPKQSPKKEPLSAIKPLLTSKYTENFKLHSQELSLMENKPLSFENPNDLSGNFTSPGRLHHLLADDFPNHASNSFKYDVSKSRKIEFLENNSESVDKSKKFGYFFLPKYPIEEKAIQTDLTMREIDSLKYVAEEFQSLKEDFLLNFISLHPDVMKKLYYKALKRKDVGEHVKVSIKKRVHHKAHEKKTGEEKKVGRTSNAEKKKNLSLSAFEEKSQDQSKAPTKPNTTEENLKRSASDIGLSKSLSFPLTNPSLALITEQTSNLTNPKNGPQIELPQLIKDDSYQVSENFLKKKHIMENLFDDEGKPKKEDSVDKSDSQSFTPSLCTGRKDINFNDKMIKKQLSLEKKFHKMQKKQEFNPFRFFKEEYLGTHSNLDPVKAEQVKF